MEAIRNFLAIPFGWLLGLFYDLSGNYLLSLVLITLIVRLVLLAPSIKQQKNSAKQMRLQAKINKIRAKYPSGTREAQMKISEETQELYKREGFSASTAGCLPLLIQLPVMLGLYGAIYAPISKVLNMSDAVMEALKSAYLSLENATADAYRLELNILNRFSEVLEAADKNVITEDVVNTLQSFIDRFQIFGVDLTEMPNEFRTIGTAILLIPVFAFVTSMLSSLFMMQKQKKTNPEMAKNPTMGCMTFMSPVISGIFAYTLPAGVGFYWIISNILSFIQTVALAIFIKPENIIAGQMIDETVERRSREESIKKRVAIMKSQEEKTK